MINLSMAVQTIKDSISAMDVGAALGLEIRHGRCRCPIHGGGDFNCVLYKGNRGFYCHVCKAGGDVISFVQQYNESSFKDAVSWINATFHMGLDLDGKIDPVAARQAKMAKIMRKFDIEFQQWKERMQFDLALTADQIVEILEEQRDRHMPKHVWERWDEKFCEAVRLLPAAQRFAENCMMECMKEDKDG